MRILAAIVTLMLSWNVSAESEQTQAAWMSSPLVSSTGQGFDLESLSGKLVLVNFMFTNCGNICPMQTVTLRQVLRTLDSTELNELVVLSISIDPERDSPEVLASYKSSYEIDSDAWIFSTGSNESIDALTSAFHALSDDGDVLDHRGRYHLLDRNGRLLLSYNSSATNVDRISRDLKNAVVHL